MLRRPQTVQHSPSHAATNAVGASPAASSSLRTVPWRCACEAAISRPKAPRTTLALGSAPPRDPPRLGRRGHRRHRKSPRAPPKELILHWKQLAAVLRSPRCLRCRPCEEAEPPAQKPQLSIVCVNVTRIRLMAILHVWPELAVCVGCLTILPAHATCRSQDFIQLTRIIAVATLGISLSKICHISYRIHTYIIYIHTHIYIYIYIYVGVYAMYVYRERERIQQTTYRNTEQTVHNGRVCGTQSTTYSTQYIPLDIPCTAYNMQFILPIDF